MSATSVATGAITSQSPPASRSRPLRVLQVIASVAAVNGGASTAMWSTLKALRGRNIHCELVTTNEDGLHKLMDVPFGGFVLCGGHRVQYFPAQGNRYTTSWPLARWLWSHVRDYDVIHIHGLFRFAPVVAAHVALMRGVPYVLTLHNTLGHWGMQNRRRLMKRWSIGLVEGRVLDHASRVHLCSSDELSQVSSVRELGQRSRVFPLGVDLTGEESSRQNSDISAQLRLFAGRPVVLFMSRIHEIKGVDRLLTAFAAIRHTRPDVLLAIAGTGDKRLMAALHQQARQLGIEDHTHWLGFVQGQQKQELLSLATVFVLPSHSENFGYAVLEAMQAGLVVVTTQNVPAGEFVTEAKAGIVYDGSVAQLERSIIEILDLPDAERREIGLRASTEVRDRLSMQTFGDSLESLYRDAARSC